MAVLLETFPELGLRKDFFISAGMLEGLNRINQIGAQRAQEALVRLLGQEEPVKIEAMSILPLTLLAHRLRRTKEDYLGCHICIFGELQAELYCYLRAGDARLLVNAVLRPGLLRRANRSVELAALAEVTNVLANSYWVALHGHVPLDWRISPPALVARVERVFALASRIGHYDHLVFQADLLLVRLGIHLYFCLIPGADCLNRLLGYLEPDRLRPLVRS
ncbi:MAG: hypothetical protein ACUVRM_00765 [Bacillota bacterium]